MTESEHRDDRTSILQSLQGCKTPESKALVFIVREQEKISEHVTEVFRELVGDKILQKPGIIRRVHRLEVAGVAILLVVVVNFASLYGWDKVFSLLGLFK